MATMSERPPINPSTIGLVEMYVTEALEMWEHCMTHLEADPLKLDREIDWVIKYRLVEAYRARHGLGLGDPKLQMMDLQYHDVRPERSLYERLVRAGTVERVLDEAEVTAAIEEPPAETRAWFRGTCLARWPQAVVAANWDSVVLDVGVEPLRRIPMMDPLKGTRAHVAALLEACETPLDLVERLAAPTP